MASESMYKHIGGSFPITFLNTEFNLISHKCLSKLWTMDEHSEGDLYNREDDFVAEI